MGTASALAFLEASLDLHLNSIGNPKDCEHETAKFLGDTNTYLALNAWHAWQMMSQDPSQQN